MEKINVGEYIRTKKGIIGKVEHTLGSYKFRTRTGHISNSQNYYYIDNPKQRGNISELSITKHSKNIIDLIEVGDIVKVHIFADIADEDSEEIETYCMIESKYEITELKESAKINYLKILQILTHEQFEQNSYKIGE